MSYYPCVCSHGKYGPDRLTPVASLLVFISSISRRSWRDPDPPKRQQKSSGSVGLCADCIAKICDGEPLPQKLRDGISEACKVMGIELQRALPLKTKPAKKVKRSK